jgi:hypothetical protein
MAHNRTFPPCPSCGAQRTANNRGVAKPLMTFWANDGEIPCYYLKCGHCGHIWMAGIFPLPPAAGPSQLDEMLRMGLRNRARAKFGYVPTGENTTSRGPKRISSDRLLFTISVFQGVISDALRKRLAVKASGITNSPKAYRRQFGSRPSNALLYSGGDSEEATA